MNNVMTVFMGFSGCGILAAIAYFITDKIGNKSKIINSVHNVIQDQGKEKIKEIENDQIKIVEKIQKGEQLRKKSIDKIKKIQKKASIEIQEILKEEKVSVINNSIDDEWDKMSNELG